MPRAIGRRFFARDTLEVAAALIGTRLVREGTGVRCLGRIVETEAYRGEEDRACHASRGRTRRTEVMFGPPGHAYVYLIYGMHHCLNVVTQREGYPAAVLIRAVEVLEPGDATGASGPGRLCRVFDIDRSLDGHDLIGSPSLRIERPPASESAPRVGTSPRIGVDYAGSWAARRWRFFDRDSPAVSGPRRLRG